MDYFTLYEVQKVLEGIIPGNKTVRQNWLQSLFGNFGLTTRETINLDREFNTGNVMISTNVFHFIFLVCQLIRCISVTKYGIGRQLMEPSHVSVNRKVFCNSI